MENIQRIQHSRKGHRSHLTKVLNKAAKIMEDEAPNTMQIASLTATIEQLARKRTILNEINEKIISTIEDPDELEQEIMETEDIESEINEKTAQISAFISSSVQTPIQNPPGPENPVSPTQNVSQATPPQAIPPQVTPPPSTVVKNHQQVPVLFIQKTLLVVVVIVVILTQGQTVLK